MGSGYGRVLRYLQSLNFSNTLGIDGSPSMLKRCHLLSKHNVLVADAVRLPIKDETADCVLCLGTLSSLSLAEQRRAAVQEITRVLNPGGILVCEDFLVTPRGRRLLRYLWNMLLRAKPFGNFTTKEGIEFHHFRTAEVCKLLRDAGLTIIDLTKHVFPTMHENMSLGFTTVARKEP